MKPILNLKPYTVTRTTAPAPVAGRAVAGVQTSVPIKANIHNVDDRAMLALPEARRSDDVRYCFTSTELFVEGRDVGGTKYKADRVMVNGEMFEVFKVSAWDGFFRCYIAKAVTP